ncbi:MAG: hypothetical protein CMH98_04660 [Oceanospirillaceae bacterium]|nr:hypothetical protein [Oceanospirillaceae bacterium]
MSKSVKTVNKIVQVVQDNKKAYVVLPEEDDDGIVRLSKEPVIAWRVVDQSEEDTDVFYAEPVVFSNNWSNEDCAIYFEVSNSWHIFDGPHGEGLDSLLDYFKEKDK